MRRRNYIKREEDNKIIDVQEWTLDMEGKHTPRGEGRGNTEGVRGWRGNIEEVGAGERYY